MVFLRLCSNFPHSCSLSASHTGVFRSSVPILNPTPNFSESLILLLLLMRLDQIIFIHFEVIPTSVIHRPKIYDGSNIIETYFLYKQTQNLIFLIVGQLSGAVSFHVVLSSLSIMPSKDVLFMHMKGNGKEHGDSSLKGFYGLSLEQHTSILLMFHWLVLSDMDTNNPRNARKCVLRKKKCFGKVLVFRHSVCKVPSHFSCYVTVGLVGLYKVFNKVEALFQMSTRQYFF